MSSALRPSDRTGGDSAIQAEYQSITRWFFFTFLAWFATSGIFCWTTLFMVTLLDGMWRRSTNTDLSLHHAFRVIAVTVAALIATLPLGITLRLFPRDKRLMVCGGCLIGVGATLFLLKALGVKCLRGMWDAAFPLPVWILYGCVVAVVALFLAQRFAKSLPLPTQDTNAAPGVEGHVAILLLVWLSGGLLAFPGGARELLAFLGTWVFVLHTYPRYREFPRISWRKNLSIILPVGFGFWMLARDLPLLITGKRTWSDGTQTYPFPFPIFGDSIGVFAISIFTAVAIACILSVTLAKTRVPQYRQAFWHGGGLLLLLSLPLYTNWMRLPLSLLLFLYMYYLFTQVRHLRSFFRWGVLLCTWIPVVALYQYIVHYTALTHKAGHTLPLWAYTIGIDEPFIWRDNLSDSISILLLMLYALWRTSKSRKERLFFLLYGSALLPVFILTFGRAGWIAFVGAALLGGIWFGTRRYRQVTLAVIGMVGLGVLVYGLGLIHLPAFIEREDSNYVRIHCVQLTWRVLTEHPVLGIAPWQWDEMWRAQGYNDYGPGFPFVGWMQIPVSGGIVGIILMSMFLVTITRKVYRTLHRVVQLEDRVLLQSAVLGIVAIGIQTCMNATMLFEGAVLTPILLAMLLAYKRRLSEGILGKDTSEREKAIPAFSRGSA